MNLRIDPEFHALIPPLTPEERQQLEANVVADGCREPLVIWNGAIVDGHNRHEICSRKNIKFTTTERDFADRDEAKAWIIRNQFGRRNLTSYQRAQLALELDPLLAKQAKENQRTSTGGANPQLLQNSVKAAQQPFDRQKELSKIAGVSHDTIHKVRVIEREATPAAKDKLQRGESSINATYRELRPAQSTPASKARNRKPDFSIVSPRALPPTIPHSTAPLMVPVNLPPDPVKAAWALRTIFDDEFLASLAQEINRLLDAAKKGAVNE